MQPRNPAIVEKASEEVGVALHFVEGVSLEAFLDDEKLKRAVCMTVINVGEL